MQHKTNYTAINNYANSMFSHEHLNESWLLKCQKYLEYIFTDLKGKVVVDYAFGRGNWSVAFLKAGAKRVYAIDASIDNCQRLSDYCKKNNIHNIEVIHSNIIETPLTLEADLLWVYGVLHHIKEIDLFLSHSKKLLSNNGQAYFYYYNKGSLRNVIVELCRKLYTFSDPSDFYAQQWLLPRDVKKRASDDLVAPYIDWQDLNEFSNTLQKNGYYPVRQADMDLYEFEHDRKNQEFYPHQLLCSLKQNNNIKLIKENWLYSYDIADLQRFLKEVLLHPALIDNRKNMSLGLYNTHSVNVKNGLIEKAVLECFIYGLRALLELTDNEVAAMSVEVHSYKSLLIASIQDEPRSHYKDLIGNNIFTHYLCENCIRI